MKSLPVCRTIQIQGKQHYLWRAVDQEGDVVDVFLQSRRDGKAGKRFFTQRVQANGYFAIMAVNRGR
jgi:transposase-like protein